MGATSAMFPAPKQPEALLARSRDATRQKPKQRHNIQSRSVSPDVYAEYRVLCHINSRKTLRKYAPCTATWTPSSKGCLAQVQPALHTAQIHSKPSIIE